MKKKTGQFGCGREKLKLRAERDMVRKRFVKKKRGLGRH